MATNNFKPFATASGANVVSQSDYEQLQSLATGFQSGKASSAQINKALRQSTTMAAVLAQFIADKSGKDVLDDGTVATLVTNLLAALKANNAEGFLQTANSFLEIKNAGPAAVAAALANLGLGEAFYGRLIGVQKFSTSGSYTPTANTKAILVDVLGGGGGGGNASATSSSSQSVGAGGGGGGYARSYLTTVPNSALVIIGAGGAAASAGGRSSFNGSIIASGGETGFSSLSNAWSSGVTQNFSGAGGSASGGNLINAAGSDGVQSLYTTFGNCLSGSGGASHFSGMVRGIGGGYGNGRNGTQGSGGSGANSQSTTQYKGGTGGDGFVIVYEFG